MVSLQGLGKVFNKGQSNEVQALQEVELTIERGGFVVLVGSNGSGKSTLLNLLAGNYPPSSGKIFIDGTDVTNWKDYRRSAWVARVFQNPMDGTAEDLTVWENFRLASLRTASKSLRIGLGSSFKKKVKDEVAALGLGLENKMHQKMGSLSGGQRQVLSLLMVIQCEVKVLLLDEPTSALDPFSAEIVLQTANRLIQERGMTAIMVTHDLKEAYKSGNRLLQLGGGRILRDLSATQKSQISLEDMYQWFIR